tara:strand:+ start:1076 stop:1405 length:330 start_codon:yes stop_codon:yes gene_type:complete
MLKYDKEIFAAFKALSIKSVDQIKLGKTYYGNHIREFKALGILTEKGYYKSLHRVVIDADDTNPFCIITDDNSVFLRDNNIGASYNPWLIFENKALAKACKEMLKVSIK